MQSPLIHRTQIVAIEETAKNINSQFSITPDVQLMLANGNTQFMIELAKELKFSYTLPTIALQMAAKFFHIRCYINYDRFIILTACLLLAAKLKDMDLRVKNICYAFYTTINNRSQSHEPYDEEKLRKIRDQICIAEAQILRTLQYDIDCTTPHDYARKYNSKCIESSCPQKNKIYDVTRLLIMDSNRAQLSLYFSPLTIFIAAIMIACSYENTRPYLYLQKSPLTNTENAQSIQVRSQQELYKQWLDTISANEGQKIKQENVKQCIRMLNRIIFAP